MYHIWWVKLIKMKIVFYSLILNHHQSCVADELYRLIGDSFRFVETAECRDYKGSTEDFSKRPYLIQAWESETAYLQAMNLATTASVCVFSGCEALPFEKARMKAGLFSLDMSERMLKRGWVNLLSPRIMRMVVAYHIGAWSTKPLYKLCCSSFAKADQYKLYSFKNKCYKWGYFVDVPDSISESCFEVSKECIRFMWCARFLKLKHPEMVLEMAQKLKNADLNFHIDIYGDEGDNAPNEEVFRTEDLLLLSKKFDIEDRITFHGKKANNIIISEMRDHDVFLFTSDNREGWGVVVNESMANGCAVISSDAIGSTEYLIKDGITGFSFKNLSVNSLTEKAKWLIEHPSQLRQMKKNAYFQMRDLWSAKKAAAALLLLCEELQRGGIVTIQNGPCSKA